jgi:hypothetical protein
MPARQAGAAGRQNDIAARIGNPVLDNWLYRAKIVPCLTI